MHMLAGGVAAGASLAAVDVGRAFAVPLPATKPQWVEPRLDDIRTISFEHEWTGEKLSVPYFERGHVLIDALAEIDHILRDHRNNKVHTTDPAMLDILVAMRQRLGTDAPIHVVCGYRSPETNAMLVEQSDGVAKQSFHMAGMAIDIRIPDRDLSAMRAVALDLQMGGVGYYPKSNFLHIDSGPVRTWN
jgi:uncharacterized protein YcbK (DUF882 family)